MGRSYLVSTVSDKTASKITRDVDWPTLRRLIVELAKRRKLSKPYLERLAFELKEIEKQGAAAAWVDRFNSGFKYNTNKNGLVFPWLLGMTDVDPMLSEHKIDRSSDWPDIDFDALPDARDHIKDFAAKRFGEDRVCSVGTWQTFLFKSALKDVVRATGGDMGEASRLTESLPADVDDLKEGGMAPCSNCLTKHSGVKCPKCGSTDTEGVTIGQLLERHESLRNYAKAHPDIIKMALKLVGKIRTMGKHAGGIIIAGLSKGKGGQRQWISMWTEGRNSQLSKLGYLKWDILGLKTLQYIHDACRLIEKTRGIKFDVVPWWRNDPEAGHVGIYTTPDGKQHQVRMDDPKVFELYNSLRVETLFQFETNVQREVLSNGVRSYADLQAFNALGHPGPLQCIPLYVKRRDDDEQSWRKEEHPEIAKELADTFGIIVYQEQLTNIWRKFAGFTSPEAEWARKAVAKKKTSHFRQIRRKWLRGATKSLGKEWAEKMWERMATFARYAFNRSHSCAYIMVAYWCAWLKAHFAPEWWASVMSSCHNDRIPRYINIARSEGVKFGRISADSLSKSFSVTKDFEVVPGLISIRGIGDRVAEDIERNRKSNYVDIDDFVQTHGARKTVLEPLIKLGAFTKWHPNIKATWMWYQYKYGKDAKSRELRQEINKRLWPDDKVEAERKRLIAEYKRLYPNRKKIPNKLLKWSPPPATRQQVMDLFANDDYGLSELLAFERQYLGFYWHSPLDLYDGVTLTKTRRGNEMARITITDGLSSAVVNIWHNQLDAFRPYLKEGVGLKLVLIYDKLRGSFTVSDNSTPIPLTPKVASEHLMGATAEASAK